MNRIAILSDIHGNLPALESVLEDIGKRAIHQVICLGDLVGKGPNPIEVIDLVRASCDFVVQGNWDIGITKEQTLAEGIWQQQQIGAERLDYLRTLPYSMDFVMSGKRIRCFHASAKSVYHRVLQSAPLSEWHAMFEHTAMTGGLRNAPTPDIVGYGDIHTSFFTPLTNPWTEADSLTERRGRLVFNVGSVGLPYDGVPQASYVIVEGEYEKEEASVFSMQFVRVSYDIEKAIHLAQLKKIPNVKKYIFEVKYGIEYSKKNKNNVHSFV